MSHVITESSAFEFSQNLDGMLTRVLQRGDSIVIRMEHDSMKIELEANEALVLFELLASAKLATVIDSAEAAVLSGMLSALERELVEPFCDDYPMLVANAKRAILAKYDEQVPAQATNN